MSLKIEPTYPPRVIRTLTDTELLHIVHVAGKQNGVKEMRGVDSRRVDPQKTDFLTHLIGKTGEYAFARELNANMDRELYAGNDGGIDLRFCGLTFQVKTYTFTGPNLEVFVREGELTADVLAAVQWLDPVTVNLLGCISTKNFNEKKFSKTYGHGPNVAVRWDALTPVLECLRRLKEKADAAAALARADATAA